MRLFNIMDTAFSNFDNTVRTYLQRTFNDLGINYTHNQIFGVIFDGIKGIMQNVMFYIEDAFTEQNIYTAQRKKSVYSLAKISGYEPYYGSAATGTVYCKVNITNGLPDNGVRLYIKNNTTVMNKSTGVIYTIMLPTNYYVVDLSKPLITHEFKLVQGAYRTATYLASGYALETIDLTGSANYDDEYITVNVGGEEWTRVSNLYEMTEDSKTFIVTPGYDSTVSIMFGNGIYGRIPGNGTSIIIKYINHLGSAGNISIYDNYRFVFNDYADDNVGNSVDLNDYCKLTVNNMITGGTDPDSIAMVREMIGYNSRSNVLASEQNFKLFLKRFSFIGISNVWNKKNSTTLVITALTNYYNIQKTIDKYFNIDLTQLYLSEEQKNIVKHTLNNSNKTYAGINIEFKDPLIRRYAMICYVKSSVEYNKDDIKINIRNTIADYFINIKYNTKFISKSEIIKLIIDSDNNIKAFDFNFISELAEDTYYNGYYDIEVFDEDNYVYTTKRILYEPETTPGLDIYGNITLTSDNEIAMLHGGFKYYPNKQSMDKSTSIMIEPIQIIFI